MIEKWRRRTYLWIIKIVCVSTKKTINVPKRLVIQSLKRKSLGVAKTRNRVSVVAA